ncbi:MAG: EamA family transporter [Burkholderiaceae bacterium]
MLEGVPSWLWILFTLWAAGCQTARNAMQRGLTSQLGTVGATHVRFLFGLPFALIFLSVVWLAVDWPVLNFNGAFFAWLLFGALAQIIATAWMLSAMQMRSFVVATAAIKTEPIQVAVFGAAFLGERIGLLGISAVIIATAGVVLMSWPSAVTGAAGQPSTWRDRWWPLLVGIGAGGVFALSAVGFRGAILSLGDAPFYVRASTVLACGLALQSVLLSAWLLWRDRAAFSAILKAWRPSLLAGLLGAAASLGWFLAFSVETVSRVRTLALVEVLLAQVVSRKIFSQRTSPAEALGISLIVAGVVLLLNSS